MLLRELDSFWKRTFAIAFLACALALPAACGDDTDTNTDPLTGDDDTGDDDSEEDAGGDDDTDDVADDDSDPADDDDDRPPTGNLDGGVRRDGGRMDARVVDSSASDAGDAGDAGGDSSVSPTDAGGMDAMVESDAAVDDAGETESDASSDARAPVEREDLGKGNGRDVVLIGDSWMNNALHVTPLIGGPTGGGIGPALIRLTGQRYRDYARQGTQLLAGSLTFGPAIPTQFDDAVRENRDIKTVIMSAGGNDVLLNEELRRDCAAGGSLCAGKLEEVGRALAAFWGRMAAAGVQDIVHLLYASEAGDGLADREKNNARLQEICDAVPAPTRCHLFETDDLVGANDLIRDGIHPNATANERIASAIAKFLEENGIRR